MRYRCFWVLCPEGGEFCGLLAEFGLQEVDFGIFLIKLLHEAEYYGIGWCRSICRGGSWQSKLAISAEHGTFTREQPL